MTVTELPDRDKVHALGDLAEALVPVAGELAFLIRTEAPETIRSWFAANGLTDGARVTETTRAFMVVLAAMIPVDSTPGELLEWADGEDRERTLRTAHSQAAAYRRMGRPVPQHLVSLEREYDRWRKRVQRAAAGEDADAAA